jgi:thiamine-phosphate pyrophosphorylase
MRGFYPILDWDACQARGLDILAAGRAILAARPPLLQLRAKNCGARQTLELLQALRSETRQVDCLLFANDRPDLALLAGCDGVHVGQSDVSIADVRAFAPNLKVGVSTHSLTELAQALDERPDYVALGPIFKTSSKKNAEPEVGMANLLAAGKRCKQAGVPLVAIGGIGLAHTAELRESAELIAVISATLGDNLEQTRNLAGQFAAQCF